MARCVKSVRVVALTCALAAVALVVTSAAGGRAFDVGPRNVRVQVSQPTALKVLWTPSGQDDRSAGYRVYLDGTSVTVTTGLHAWLEGLSCETSYSIGVSVAAGSAPTASATASTQPCAGGASTQAQPTPTTPTAVIAPPSPLFPFPSPEPVEPPAVPPAPPASGESVVLVDTQWRCRGAVDLDLVKVTMRKAADAISIGTNCSGRIGRVEVDTWGADGIKVQNAAPVPHDLVIGGGYVKCHAAAPGTHQDGVQAMGGTRLAFRGLAIDCLGNSNFFVNAGGSGASTPTDVVCDGCTLGPRSASTLFVGTSVRSGARGSVICEGRYIDVRIGAATSPVNDGNSVAPASDPRCA